MSTTLAEKFWARKQRSGGLRDESRTRPEASGRVFWYLLADVYSLHAPTFKALFELRLAKNNRVAAANDC